MYETEDDLDRLQTLLDASYARAGSHLRSIWDEPSRLDARALRAELAGVQVLDLATVTPRGEPRVAPVDGLFFRGRFWFGSAEHSQRFRNIRANPALYDFDWDAAHPTAPYAWIDASTLFAFRRP